MTTPTPTPIQLRALRRGDRVRWYVYGGPREGVVDLIARYTVNGAPHVRVHFEGREIYTGPDAHQIEALELADRSATLDGRKTTTSSRARRGNRHDQRSALPRRADEKDPR